MTVRSLKRLLIVVAVEIALAIVLTAVDVFVWEWLPWAAYGSLVLLIPIALRWIFREEK
jgi:hypothetical protein